MGEILSFVETGLSLSLSETIRGSCFDVKTRSPVFPILSQKTVKLNIVRFSFFYHFTEFRTFGPTPFLPTEYLDSCVSNCNIMPQIDKRPEKDNFGPSPPPTKRASSIRVAPRLFAFTWFFVNRDRIRVCLMDVYACAESIAANRFWKRNAATLQRSRTD